ncbi:hypothetical protein NFI96_032190, partial [Prochilodus magdalenae]
FSRKESSHLAAKYDYLEKLTRKVCHSQTEAPKKRAYVWTAMVMPGTSFHFSDVVIIEEGGPPKKKQKKETEAYQRKYSLNTNDKKPAPRPSRKQHRNQPVRRYIMLPRCVIFLVVLDSKVARSEKEFNAVDILREKTSPEDLRNLVDRVLPKTPPLRRCKKRRATNGSRRVERKKRKKKRVPREGMKIKDNEELLRASLKRKGEEKGFRGRRNGWRGVMKCWRKDAEEAGQETQKHPRIAKKGKIEKRKQKARKKGK